MNERIPAIALLFVFIGWILSLPLTAAAGSDYDAPYSKKSTTLQRKAPVFQAAPGGGNARVLENEQTEQHNKMVDEQNREIEAMEEEADDLEEELKNLEQGGGG